jgi:hypothetical protein
VDFHNVVVDDDVEEDDTYTKGDDEPFRDIDTTLPSKHGSTGAGDSVTAVPSGESLHGIVLISIYESAIDQPSPIHDDCDCVVGVRPSTKFESYDNDKSGAKEVEAPGSFIGYEYVNEPESPPSAHVPEGLSGVAL